MDCFYNVCMNFETENVDYTDFKWLDTNDKRISKVNIFANLIFLKNKYFDD